MFELGKVSREAGRSDRNLPGQLSAAYRPPESPDSRNAPKRCQACVKRVPEICICRQEWLGTRPDVFAIQEEIARSIAQALRITLTPQEEKTIARRPTENPQAYDFYLRGRSYARRENLDYGLQMFEQAIQLDPNVALAHAGIAHLCGLVYEIREQNPKWIERGLAACDRATALAPDLPEVLVARAHLLCAKEIRGSGFAGLAGDRTKA